MKAASLIFFFNFKNDNEIRETFQYYNRSIFMRFWSSLSVIQKIFFFFSLISTSKTIENYFHLSLRSYSMQSWKLSIWRTVLTSQFYALKHIE